MGIFGNFSKSQKIKQFSFDDRIYKPFNFGWLIAEICVDQSVEVIQGALLGHESFDNQEIYSAISSNPQATQHYVIPYLVSTFSAITCVLEDMDKFTAEEFIRGVESYYKSSPFGTETADAMLSLCSFLTPKISQELIAIREKKLELSNITSAKEIAKEMILGLNYIDEYKAKKIQINESDMEKLALSFKSAAFFCINSCLEHRLHVVS